MKTLYEIKQQKARIDTMRIENGLQPVYSAYEKEHSGNEFRAALLANIRSYIASAKRAGTVAMTVDNLKQCVRTPSPLLAGAPNGTNAQYFYAQMFRELCASDKAILTFTRI